MSASYNLKTVLRPDGHLVLLDYLRDHGIVGNRRGLVRVFCKLCHRRKVMLRQVALEATSCGCILNTPIPCPRCHAMIVKRGMAGHIKFAHERVDPKWWGQARRMRSAGATISKIAITFGKSWEQAYTVCSRRAA